MIREIINGILLIMKRLLFAVWLVAFLAIVIGIPYRIATVGWDEFVRPAKEATAEEMKLSRPHD